MKTDVVLLCCGQSKRMGYPKMLLPYNYLENFFTHIVSVYASIQSEIYVVISKENYKQLSQYINIALLSDSHIHYIVNNQNEKDRMYSIFNGLKHCRNDYVFIQNIDNPFITKELLFNMINKCKERSYVKPVFNGKGGHPILLHSSIKNLILNSFPQNNFLLKDYLQYFNKIEISCNTEKITANINTIDDYNYYFKLSM
ncbi:MAG: NTP transferase domain-containing protein [Bacteroidota bacterium]